MARAPAKHYVDNKRFFTEILHYKALCVDAEKAGKSKPRIPPYLGECLYKIAFRLSLKPNFVNYTFREDMVADGLEKCIAYFDNFNPEKSTNPFAYFTQIIYYAFLTRINSEKKHLYIKQKTLENFYFEGMLAEQGAGGEERNVNVDLDNDYMQNLVANYDRKQAEKKEKIKAKKAEIGLEKFYEADDIDEELE
ncbi:RNA polymerase sigma factor [uncultured Caudovirales phage]|uniref:RNA polymerase sigma-like factor n=1 Tax=uncultured Caudovirales phage TaxID=2100421 RepID=A0A6J7WX32_9CAUD|nr:RNA polymerase sigma factor [uncultured Caudovirales phage]